MDSVIWAALAIGGSTLIGTGCGFLFSRVSDKWNDAVTAFAAGVMLAAAMFGLYVPAMELAVGAELIYIVVGTACGALMIRGVGVISGKMGLDAGFWRKHPEILFVLAIALHKFPEGMAGGVGLSGMDRRAALTVVVGVALQNLPEGVVMIPPLLNAGVHRRWTACIAIATGMLNAAGVFAGALWGRLAAEILPFALAFAGGAMLDVILAQMIPKVTCSNRLNYGTLVMLGGFMIMTCVNVLC